MFFMFLIFILVGLLAALLPLALLVFWIWMLVDCVSNKNLPDIQRVIWILLMVTTNIIGALIYFFVGRSPKTYATPPYYQPQVYQQPLYAQPPTAERSYQEGYRPQEVPHRYQKVPAPPVEQIGPEQQQAEYEQIQISYPESF